jgi:hypothetical protein
VLKENIVLKWHYLDGIKNNPKGKNKKQHTTVTTD